MFVWQLLKEKALLPDLSHKVDDIVFPLDEVLDSTASSIASSLRKKGRSVDLVEDKRLKWLVSIITRYISLDLACLVGNCNSVPHILCYFRSSYLYYDFKKRNFKENNIMFLTTAKQI